MIISNHNIPFQMASVRIRTASQRPRLIGRTGFPATKNGQSASGPVLVMQDNLNELQLLAR